MSWDLELFTKINNEWTNEALDVFLPFMRDASNWYPLYAILIIYAVYKFKQGAILWVFMAMVTIGVTDGVSNYVFKKNFERPRPCHAESQVDARLLVHCGSGFSFTSNHASNHMAMAIFFSLSLFSSNIWVVAFILWALLIGYAQIYVGVHYPADVLGGFCLGFILGLGGLSLYNYLDKKFHVGPVS